MSGEPHYLSRAAIHDGFTLLAAELAMRHIVGSVYLFGGGAMLMAFDDREATRDLDARLTGDMRDAINAVATHMQWPPTWLNDQGTVYLPTSDDPHPAAVFDHANLRVMRASDRHLLAMKTAAARSTIDEGDLRRLIDHLHLNSVGEVVRIHDEVFPANPLSPRRLEVIQSAIDGLR